MPDYQHAQDAMAVVLEMKSAFRARDAYYAAINTTVFKRHAVQVPESLDDTTLQVKSPLAFHAVNMITAALSVNPPLVQYPPTQIGRASCRERV